MTFCSQGDHCGIYGSNYPEWVIAMEACNSKGICYVPMYDTLGPNAVDFIINYAEISIALVHTSKMKSEIAFIQKVVNGTILRDEKRCRRINAAGIDYESPYMDSQPKTSGG